MKNMVKLFGIIAIIVVIGFSMTACDLFGEEEEETTSLEGYWGWSIQSYEFNGDTFHSI